MTLPEPFDYVFLHPETGEPVRPGDADGVQPIEVEILVSVEGFDASERIGVFFGGCG